MNTVAAKCTFTELLGVKAGHYSVFFCVVLHVCVDCWEYPPFWGKVAPISVNISWRSTHGRSQRCVSQLMPGQMFLPCVYGFNYVFMFMHNYINPEDDARCLQSYSTVITNILSFSLILLDWMASKPKNPYVSSFPFLEFLVYCTTTLC